MHECLDPRAQLSIRVKRTQQSLSPDDPWSSHSTGKRRPWNDSAFTPRIISIQSIDGTSAVTVVR